MPKVVFLVYVWHPRGSAQNWAIFSTHFFWFILVIFMIMIPEMYHFCALWPSIRTQSPVFTDFRYTNFSCKGGYPRGVFFDSGIYINGIPSCFIPPASFSCVIKKQVRRRLGSDRHYSYTLNIIFLRKT